MRMDTDARLTAADVVNSYDQADLAEMLQANSDERFARRIAKAIIEARPIEGTFAGRDRRVSHPGRSPANRGPSGQAHLSSDPHRGQR